MDKAHSDALIGKEVSNVDVGKDIAFINFTDGTNISVAHDGDKINMIYQNEQSNAVPVIGINDV